MERVIYTISDSRVSSKKCSFVLLLFFSFTMVQKDQVSRCKCWATHSSVRSFTFTTGTTHFARELCCAQWFTRSPTHSLPSLGKRGFCQKYECLYFMQFCAIVSSTFSTRDRSAFPLRSDLSSLHSNFKVLGNAFDILRAEI